MVYVPEFKKGQYLAHLTKQSITLTEDRETAMKFINLKDAQKSLDRAHKVYEKIGRRLI